MRVDRDAAASQRARFDRGEDQRLRTAVDLDERLLQRLADLAGEQARELLAALADRGGGSVEDLRALVRGQRGFDLRHATSGSTTDEVRCYTTVFLYADTPFAP